MEKIRLESILQSCHRICINSEAFPLKTADLAEYLKLFAAASDIIFANGTAFRKGMCALFSVESCYDPLRILILQVDRLTATFEGGILKRMYSESMKAMETNLISNRGEYSVHHPILIRNPDAVLYQLIQIILSLVHAREVVMFLLSDGNLTIDT